MKKPIRLWHVLALSVAISLGGCGLNVSEQADESPVRVEGTPPPLADSPDAHAGHAHPTEGLHGGHLYEIGNEQYYAEMLQDESTHKTTVHLLDSTAREPVTTTVEEVLLHLFDDGQFVAYSLKPVNANGTGASQFEVISERLCELMDHDKSVRGRMHIKIGDESFIVAIEHDPHEGHDGDDDDHHEHASGQEGQDHDDDGHDHP